MKVLSASAEVMSVYLSSLKKLEVLLETDPLDAFEKKIEQYIEWKINHE